MRHFERFHGVQSAFTARSGANVDRPATWDVILLATLSEVEAELEREREVPPKPPEWGIPAVTGGMKQAGAEVLASAAEMPAEELATMIYEAMALELDVVGTGDSFSAVSAVASACAAPRALLRRRRRAQASLGGSPARQNRL